VTGDDRPAPDANPVDRLPLLENGREQSSSKPSRKRRAAWPLRLVAVLLLLLLGGVAGLYFQGPALRAVFDWTMLEPGAGARQPIALPIDRVPSPERVAAMAVGDVVALGRLQPAGGIVSVALPQGAGDARIDEIMVEAGDIVAQGAVLAVLDSLVLYESALTNAESTLAIRRAALAQARVQVAATEAELHAQSRGAEATLAAAERELARVRSLPPRLLFMYRPKVLPVAGSVMPFSAIGVRIMN